MNCLTDEQLAQLALRLDDCNDVAAHAEHCGACRTKLSETRRLTELLTASHTDVDRRLADARAQLLANLRTTPSRSPRTSVRAWLALHIERLTTAQRIAAGGIGLTTAIGVMLLFFVIGSTERLSAMERMVRQLREVKSFSFELEEISDRISGDNPRRIQRNDTNFWRAPASWHGTTKMVKLPLPPAADDVGELLTDVEEIYPPGERGILIDHMERTFLRTQVMKPDDFPDYSPVNWVQRMSKGNVKVIGDLGPKTLDGKTAHGYIVSLGNPVASSGQNAIHVWLDPETDLPIEFRYEDKAATDTIDSWTNVMRVYNCRWNVDLDDAVFEMVEPAGYLDTSWPTDPGDIDRIIESLRLYAKLSGGHYPRVTNFDGDDIDKEMQRLASIAPPPENDPNHATFLQQVQQSKEGLDWATRILRNEHHSGYYGTDVGPADEDKLLMWWPNDIGDLYRVIYGDLRTEALPYAEWSKLVLPEVAESHAPVEYTKPN
jgi:hypothetical protein